MSPKPGYFILLGLVALVCLVGGWMIGYVKTEKMYRAAAVNGGHARWVVMDENGQVAFEWAPNHAGETLPVKK